MDSSFYYAGAICGVYFILKCVESKFIVKKQLDFKKILRDTVLVYLCCILGLYLCNNYVSIPNVTKVAPKADVFVGQPGF